jgi:DegV family protein with EDD domain
VSAIGIVTDSTSTISADLLRQYDIRVAPQVVIWEEKVLQDGVDITPDEFFRRLRTASVMPTTSQATVQSFLQVYRPLVEQKVPILSLVISSKLSGTYQSAVQAKEEFPGARIEVVDSQSAAMALGFQVLGAARAAEAGLSFDEVVALAQRAQEHTGVMFVVDTLEFLHRGGRIGGASRLFGTALNIKPILELQHGRIEPAERVRTKARALARLLEILEDRVGRRTPLRLAAMHADAEAEAAELLAKAKARFSAVETMITVTSPAIGAHVGPGIVGMCYSAGL